MSTSNTYNISSTAASSLKSSMDNLLAAFQRAYDHFGTSLGALRPFARYSDPDLALDALATGDADVMRAQSLVFDLVADKLHSLVRRSKQGNL